jgi:pimeloyl-ACP methyl ester carboxylesterase
MPTGSALPPLDRSLQASTASIWLPRPDRLIKVAFKALVEGMTHRARELLGHAGGQPQLSGLRGASAPMPVRRPGDVSAAAGPGNGPATLASLRCAETGRSHPVLPQERIAQALHCSATVELAMDPHKKLPADHGLQDAFLSGVELPAGPAGEPAQTVSLLPDSVMRSSLLNARLDKLTGAAGSSKGSVVADHTNSLFDSGTGLAASITVNSNRQVTIAFGGMGSQNTWMAQFTRAAANILGLLPPQNMRKAAELTQQVKAHIDQLNSRLPPEEHFSLNLAGHSLGGALATYAALQNQVPATVTCPMRLGWGARASLGREAMAGAPHWVTEVVIKGDWVSDNAASKAYGALDVLGAGLTGSSGDNRGAIGQRFLVPRPSDEQLRAWADVNYKADLVNRDKKIDRFVARFDVHRDPDLCVELLKNQYALNAGRGAPGPRADAPAPRLAELPALQPVADAAHEDDLPRFGGGS